MPNKQFNNNFKQQQRQPFTRFSFLPGKPMLNSRMPTQKLSLNSRSNFNGLAKISPETFLG